MSERDAFGPNLRRIRMQRGISVLDIVARTNVNAALWEGLERNDLSRWPKGIYARAYVRSYANAIGVDPECAAWPVNVIACRSTPKVPSTTPMGNCLLSRTGPCSM